MISPEKNISRVLNCNGIVFEETQHPEAFRMPRHSHDQAHMAFLRNGSIHNFKGRRSSTASASTLMFMPPGETHATQYSDQVHAFYIRFSFSWWEKVSNSPLLSETRDHQNDLPAQLALRIYQEFQRRDDLTPLLLEGLTLELLVALSRQGIPPKASHLPQWVNQAQDYLHANFRQSLSIYEIANAVGVHPGHLMRGFRQHHHCTIGDYVRKLRVQNACVLMEDSEEPLSAIALFLGFSDQSHFCKTFKEVTGMTPTEWQNHFGNARRIQKTLF